MRKTSRSADALLGVGALLVAVLVVLVAVFAYERTFVSSTDVELRAGAVGNALQKGSDVKLHGVPVGEVSAVRATDDGSRVTLALDPATAKSLPADTVARILPKTLFGERYISLVIGSDPAGGLAKGGTIRQDSSSEAVEIEELFDKLLPLLRSIQPEKLAATLGELTVMLRGRGADIGDSMARWGAYLKKLNPQVPTMTEDFAKLATVAQAYDDAAPELLDALQTMTTTMGTMVDQRTQLRDAFATVITSADAAHGWVSANEGTIVVLSKRSRQALEAVKPYATQFPCLLRAARKFIPVMDKNLGKGTAEPGMHVQLNVVASRGKYLAGKDKPSYLSGKSPRCPYVTGQTGTQPAHRVVPPAGERAATGPTAAAEPVGATEPTDTAEPAVIPAPPSVLLEQQVVGAAGLGEANSPAENQLLAELLAPTQGMAPADFPSWASLLAGPVLRDTKVTLR